MSMGLVSISFRNRTPEEILKAMADTELSCIEWGSDVHAPFADRTALENIVKLQQKYNIKCSSYGTYFKIGENTTDEILPYITAAKLLGTDTLRIWCGNKSFTLYTNDEKEKILQDSIILAETAKQNNVKLCLEFHPNTYTDNAISTKKLIENVNSSFLKTYWQPNQFKSYDENIEEVSVIAEYTENIHIFNWEQNVRLPLLEARDKWIKYLSFFKDEHNILLEFMPDDKLSTLKKEAESLKEIAQRRGIL